MTFAKFARHPAPLLHRGEDLLDLVAGAFLESGARARPHIAIGAQAVCTLEGFDGCDQRRVVNIGLALRCGHAEPVAEGLDLRSCVAGHQHRAPAVYLVLARIARSTQLQIQRAQFVELLMLGMEAAQHLLGRCRFGNALQDLGGVGHLGPAVDVVGQLAFRIADAPAAGMSRVLQDEGRQFELRRGQLIIVTQSVGRQDRKHEVFGAQPPVPSIGEFLDHPPGGLCRASVGKPQGGVGPLLVEFPDRILLGDQFARAIQAVETVAQ